MSCLCISTAPSALITMKNHHPSLARHFPVMPLRGSATYFLLSWHHFSQSRLAHTYKSLIFWYFLALFCFQHFLVLKWAAKGMHFQHQEQTQENQILPEVEHVWFVNFKCLLARTSQSSRKEWRLTPIFQEWDANFETSLVKTRGVRPGWKRQHKIEGPACSTQRRCNHLLGLWWIKTLPKSLPID